MDVGSVFHAVLSDHLGRGVPLDQSLENHLKRYSGSVNKSLFKRRYDQMFKILSEYIGYDQSEETRAGRTVFRTELSFGFETSDYDSLKLTPEICVHGIVDRIDTSEDGELFVIDYKSGKNPGSAMAEQLILYSMAVENAFSEESKVLGGGEFRLIKGKKKANNFSIDHSSGERKWKFDGKLKFKICETAEKGKISDEEFIRAVEAIIKSIQSGDFSIETWKGTASNCYKCENEGIFNILKWRQKGVPTDG
jgi:ATP-dependent helicase/DNAse subunit B